jgi:hypothetical protein
MVSAA